MYLVVIAWLYVALMMAVAEATSPIGTVLGAAFTFVLYGAAPVSLVVYLMRAPARRRAIKAREAAETAEAAEATTLSPSLFEAESLSPNAGRHAAGGVEPVAGDTSIAPVRKKP